MDQFLRLQLERDEGRKAKGYKDSKGIWTLGVGHNVEHGPPIPETAIDIILENDVAMVEAELYRRIPWAKSLDPVRRGVLLNLGFNIGIPGMIRANPKMLAAVKRNDWNNAALELLDGPYKDQVGDRAIRLAVQLETGLWQ
jgi:lysozyme